MSKDKGDTNNDTQLIKVITGSENITNFMLESYPEAKEKNGYLL